MTLANFGVLRTRAGTGHAGVAFGAVAFGGIGGLFGNRPVRADGFGAGRTSSLARSSS